MEFKDLDAFDVLDKSGGVYFQVLAAPGSSSSGVRGIHDGGLKVAVRAPADKGRANKELVEVIAALAGVPKRNVEVVSGHGTRKKRISVAGISKSQFLLNLKRAIAQA